VDVYEPLFAGQYGGASFSSRLRLWALGGVRDLDLRSLVALPGLPMVRKRKGVWSSGVAELSMKRFVVIAESQCAAADLRIVGLIEACPKPDQL